MLVGGNAFFFFFFYIDVNQAERITAMLKAANVNVESYWAVLFSKLVQKGDIDDLILNEELKEENDGEIFSLFDD
ncbi:hypothetical protein RJ639_016044 [Escallonia herrerae]|uniref:Uncharacterized protein n=1 Tax=Escallonia herrerae TaxID=1293975 RepID=A0AA88VHS6_9ASTE|nr:hypothetical protein RJ639_016044 [Escallonia herrerae]